MGGRVAWGGDEWGSVALLTARFSPLEVEGGAKKRFLIRQEGVQYISPHCVCVRECVRVRACVACARVLCRVVRARSRKYAMRVGVCVCVFVCVCVCLCVHYVIRKSDTKGV